MSKSYIGVDVSKEWLDIHIRPCGTFFRVDNNQPGIASFASRLAKVKNIALVVFEATGGLEYTAAIELQEKGFPVCVVNPRRTHAFRATQGKYSKTDALDAEMIACFAEKMEPEIRTVMSKENKALKELTVRRSQIVGLLSCERVRLRQTHNPLIKEGINRLITELKKEQVVVEKALKEAISVSEELLAKYAIITSVPSIGDAVAMTLITELPELGNIGDKQISSLVGVAPHNNESGKFTGKASIKGGRVCVRNALYMAALVAIRYNSTIKPYYTRLVAAGKPKKVAIVACMRKLLLMLHTLLAENRKWEERPQVTA